MIPGRGAWLEFEVDKKDIVLRPDRPEAQAACHDPPQGPRLRRVPRGARQPRPRPERRSRTSRCSTPSTRTTPRTPRPRSSTSTASCARASRRRPDSARQLLENLFFNPKRYDMAKVGRHKVSKKLRDEYAEAAAQALRPRRPQRRPRGRPGRLPAHPCRRPRHRLVPRQAAQQRPRLLPGRHRPLREPAGPLGRGAHPEPGPRRAVPDGARRPRAHDHPGRRGDHPPDPHQHPAGRRGDQGVLRLQPAVAVHGPDQPARRADPQAAPLGARPRVACRGSGPGSRSGTCTRATTGACAPSRRRKARTSA